MGNNPLWYIAAAALLVVVVAAFTPLQRYHAVPMPAHDTVVIIDTTTGKVHATCWFSDTSSSYSDCR